MDYIQLIVKDVHIKNAIFAKLSEIGIKAYNCDTNIRGILDEYKNIKVYPKHKIYNTFKWDLSDEVKQTFTLPEQWNEAVKAITELYNEPKVKVGDWISTEFDSYFGKVTRIEGNKGWYIQPRFDNKESIWTDDGFKNSKIISEEEVKERLIEEAKGRGYKKGIQIKWFSGAINIVKKEIWQLEKKETSTIYWNEGEYMLLVDKVIVYTEKIGWVEIVKEEPIVIEGYTADFSVTGIVTFGCKAFTREQVSGFIKALEALSAHTITIGTNVIKKETLQKILENIK